MQIEKEIVKHLIKKYKPLAIALTGSRAKGYPRESSDWDIIMFSNKNVAYIGERFRGQELDMHIKRFADLKQNVLANKWSPYQKIKVLHDISKGRMKNVVQATERAYKKGPARLTNRELETQKSFDRRKIIKLISFEHNQPIFFDYVSIFFHEVIADWFILRRKWPLDILHALEVINKQDKKFYNMLIKLSSNKTNKEKIKVAKLVFQHLYGEKYSEK